MMILALPLHDQFSAGFDNTPAAQPRSIGRGGRQGSSPPAKASPPCFYTIYRGHDKDKYGPPPANQLVPPLNERTLRGCRVIVHTDLHFFALVPVDPDEETGILRMTNAVGYPMSSVLCETLLLGFDL